MAKTFIKCKNCGHEEQITSGVIRKMVMGGGLCLRAECRRGLAISLPAQVLHILFALRLASEGSALHLFQGLEIYSP